MHQSSELAGLQEEGTCLSALVGHTGGVNSVAVDAMGRFAVTGGVDGTGRVWDLKSGTCLQLLLGHTSIGKLEPFHLCSICQRLWSSQYICPIPNLH